ncbi:hypothetical protein HDV02_000923 [Globomyces sp. JEL0801]|nr:hypothetical protein HDV02_000923 [Globomyces sp. JEL0801]
MRIWNFTKRYCIRNYSTTNYNHKLLSSSNEFTIALANRLSTNDHMIWFKNIINIPHLSHSQLQIAFNSFLSFLSNSNHPISLIHDIFHLLPSQFNITPDLKNHTILLHSYYRANLHSQSLLLFDSILKLGLEPDDHVYNIIIRTHVLLGNMDKAHQLLSLYNLNTHQPPSLILWTSILIGYCLDAKKYTMQEANEIFLQIKKQGLQPDMRVYNTLILGYTIRQDYDKVLDLITEMELLSYQPDIHTYAILQRSVLLLPSHHKLSVWFINTFDHIPSIDDLLNENYPYKSIYTFKNLFSIYKLQQEQLTLDIVANIIQCNPLLKTNQVALSLILSNFIQQHSIEPAKQFISFIQANNIHLDIRIYSLIILLACQKKGGDPAQTWKLFEYMKENRISPNTITLRNLLMLAVKTSNAGKVAEIVDLIIDHTIPFTFQMYHSMIGTIIGYKKNYKWVEQIKFSRILDPNLISFRESNGIDNDSVHQDLNLMDAPKTMNPRPFIKIHSKALDILNHMLSHNLLPSQELFTQLVSICTLNHSYFLPQLWHITTLSPMQMETMEQPTGTFNLYQYIIIQVAMTTNLWQFVSDTLQQQPEYLPVVVTYLKQLGKEKQVAELYTAWNHLTTYPILTQTLLEQIGIYCLNKPLVVYLYNRIPSHQILERYQWAVIRTLVWCGDIRGAVRMATTGFVESGDASGQPVKELRRWLHLKGLADYEHDIVVFWESVHPDWVQLDDALN